MSPALSPEARGSGQRIRDDVARAGWKSWRCTLCGRSGREFGPKAARAAYQRHYDTNHLGQED